jgi:membrane-bound ClpP family serine protease
MKEKQEAKKELKEAAGKQDAAEEPSRSAQRHCGAVTTEGENWDVSSQRCILIL